MTYQRAKQHCPKGGGRPQGCQRKLSSALLTLLYVILRDDSETVIKR
jgi:hypothetical protein